MNDTAPASYLDAVHWNADGLLPVVAQDWHSGQVLMMAWMNAEALRCTVREGRAVYWSRSRQALWRKGESSGHVQHVRDIRLDCDGDTLLLQVEQEGGIACHTGRAHCFYRRLDAAAAVEGVAAWEVTDPVVKTQEEIYGDSLSH